MPVFNRLAFLLVVIVSLISCSSEKNSDILVETKEQFFAVQKELKPGDTVVIKNGEWKDFEMRFEAFGSKENPIHLTVEEKGKVIFTGQSSLALAGEHYTVSGFVFKNGYSPTGSVIQYKIGKDKVANNVRVTEAVIEEYSYPEKFKSDYWVAMYGKHNRFDHGYLAGKRNKGVTFAVRLTDVNSQENYHRIDHNYFGHRPELGSNGGETLRIGTSTYSLTSSYTTVENNMFNRCDGEVEIISIKSGNNKLLNNTFVESRGTLTLRHGNNNVVKGNVFLGNGKANTGGVRVINANQEVSENVFYKLTGYRFGSGFTVMNGVPNSRINRYHQVKNANIHHNTFIDVDHIHLAAGSDEERSAVPIDSKFTNNLILSSSVKDPFSVFDDISGILFTDNVSNVELKSPISDGFDVENLPLKDTFGYAPLVKGEQTIGAPASILPIAKDDVGPSWFVKNDDGVEFSSGKVIPVEPGAGALKAAIDKANDGDKLLLSTGEYQEANIAIDKVISIVAKDPKGTVIVAQDTNLFEIQNGGSLLLENLELVGASGAKDGALIKTSLNGMMTNYFFAINNSSVRDLSGDNYSFFAAGNRSFAKTFSISNSAFSNISGDILQLNKEQDSKGIYNVEYLDIVGSAFSDIGGAIALLRRGGKDESTFGPIVNIKENAFSAVKGVSSKPASLFLHGVQIANVSANAFSSSAPILVEHTVGEPKTTILENAFVDTDEPEIIDYLALSKK